MEGLFLRRLQLGPLANLIYLIGSEESREVGVVDPAWDVEAIVEAFKSMQDDLDREKRAFAKMWSSREQQLTRVLNNTAGMYGDIQGIVGASLPRIDMLEIESTPLLEN